MINSYTPSHQEEARTYKLNARNAFWSWSTRCIIWNECGKYRVDSVPGQTGGEGENSKNRSGKYYVIPRAFLYTILSTHTLLSLWRSGDMKGLYPKSAYCRTPYGDLYIRPSKPLAKLPFLWSRSTFALNLHFAKVIHYIKNDCQWVSNYLMRDFLLTSLLRLTTN